MSATLSISNFSKKNILEQGVLDADTAVGDGTILLQNPQNYTANSYIVIGILGGEGSELCQIDSVTGNEATLIDPLALPHSKSDAVYRLWGNQIKLYSSPNVNGTRPAIDTFSEVTDGQVAIDSDNLSTIFTDFSGSSDYWYGFTYVNSTTSLETDLSDSSFARGDGYGNYCSIESIKEEAGLKNNRYISDSLIDQKRLAAQAEINGKLAARFVVPFTAPINDYISSLTRRLAAGFLLIQQFGAYSVLDTNNGQSRIDDVRDELKELQEGTMTLIGEEGIDSSSGNGGFNGLPVDATFDATTGTGGAMFSVHDVSGAGRY